MPDADEFAFHELAQIGKLIKDQTISAREVTEMQLARVASLDGVLHSYVEVLRESALAQADTADREIADGQYRGPFHGVPIAVKDLCWVEGTATAAGTLVHKAFVPDEDATVVRRLKDAGAVFIGKTRLTEGAYSDYHPAVEPALNPWNAEYWTGISSSGSGVAVAAGLCFGAIGSDTGGSIRWPSAANGVTGIKPTWGRVSRHGVFELAASLDHVGTMARSVVDAAALLGVIAGGDPHDPTASIRPVPDYMAATIGGVAGLRIGIDRRWNSENVDIETTAAIDDAMNIFADLGAVIVEIAFPDVDQIVADWVPNCAVEVAVAHEVAYADDPELYGPVLSSVIEAGQQISGVEYQKIMLRRMAFRGQVEALFSTADVLLTPVQPFDPLRLVTIATLGEQPELIARLQRYTCPFDMSGHPTLSLPAGFSSAGMPIGLQLVAAQFDEGMLIRAGAAFQNATSWHQRHPRLDWVRAIDVAEGVQS